MNKILLEINKLTVEDLKNKELVNELINRWTPGEVPPCRVCGEKLSLGKIGGGSAIYYCSSTHELNGKLELKEKRFLYDIHESESKFTQYKFGDVFAIDLLYILLDILGIEKCK